MAGEIEPDGAMLLRQPFGRQPVVGRGQTRRGERVSALPEKGFLGGGGGLDARGGIGRQRVHRLKRAVAVRLQRVERARARQHLQRALADPFQVHPAGEVEKIPERAAFVPRLHDHLHRLDADILQCAETIDDLAVLHRERRAGSVHARRDRLDAEPVHLPLVDGELVREVQVAIHHRGHEFDRVVRLQPCGLIADHAVSGGVGFVEPVIGELVEKVPDLHRLLLIHPVFGGTGEEFWTFRVHRLLNFLAHGAAQKVSAAKRIPGHLPGDLHHLFLIDDDALRLVQDIVDQRVEAVALLPSVLDVAVFRDVLHRARAIERHQRDDILDAGRL